VAGLYVDTSALGRVLLGEDDAPSIVEALGRYDRHWSSELIVVELRRLARRGEVDASAEALLEALDLVVVDRAALEAASRIEPTVVRSLDAIHLSAAVGLHAVGDVAAVLTFDQQLRRGCEHHGITVEAPA
jgi:predicted nucleic acid-binding protein